MDPHEALERSTRAVAIAAPRPVEPASGCSSSRPRWSPSRSRPPARSASPGRGPPLIPWFEPPALHLGPITLQAFGILAALGVAVGVRSTAWAARGAVSTRAPSSTSPSGA